MNKNMVLKPMPFWESLLVFGIPAIYFYCSIYFMLPALAKAKVSPLINYSITLILPVVLLFIASLVAYKLEGHEFRWGEFKERFRLKPMKAREWIWALVLTILMIVPNSALVFTRKWLLTIPFFSPPDYLPSTLDPRVVVTGIPAEFASVPIWCLVLFQLFTLLFNILGEEFWWRGYILPRQELIHGRMTWVIHGIMWTLFHFFWKWNLVILLPGALAASYVAQRLKNTNVIIFTHLIANTVGSVILLALNNIFVL